MMTVVSLAMAMLPPVPKATVPAVSLAFPFSQASWVPAETEVYSALPTKMLSPSSSSTVPAFSLASPFSQASLVSAEAALYSVSPMVRHIPGSVRATSPAVSVAVLV